jgi:formylglycine-generating enzyme required for sulfatase activity
MFCSVRALPFLARLGNPLIWINPEVCRSISVRLTIRQRTDHRNTHIEGNRSSGSVTIEAEPAADARAPEMVMNLADTKSPSDSGQSFEHPAGAGMLYVPGGTFRMGSDRHYPEEAPVRALCRTC